MPGLRGVLAMVWLCWFGVTAWAVGGSCLMMPPSGASGQPVGLADSFDVPVVVRRSSPLRPERRLWESQIDRSRLSWPPSNSWCCAGRPLPNAKPTPKMTSGKQPAKPTAQAARLHGSNCSKPSRSLTQNHQRGSWKAQPRIPTWQSTPSQQPPSSRP